MPYHFNPVITPNHFRPGALSKSVKEYIFTKHGHTKDLDFYLGQHTEQDDKDFKKMIESIAIQDQIKNISIKDYLPEFYSLIQNSV